jgi:hypothetical protein
MAQEQRIVDASAAQMAARRHLEAQHGDKLAELKIRKCWYSTGTSKDVWEVEGIAVIKKGLFGKEQRAFKYQIDPASGAIIGFEE